MTTTQTLANKYRPTKLDEVYGQDIAVSALKGSFKKGIPSAILISGLYGSGKTSLANIYARMLNCATHNMCGKCMSCKFKKSHPDIVNHDCAVGGKIDEIRNVVNASRVAPSTRKRVIIMDEVHTLRDASEKALLIATENPSPDTVWILCTTNPEKIGKPLMTRCLHIALKPIAHEPMMARLKEIAKAEGLKPTKSLGGALNSIVAMANGSLRDAVSKLEFLILSSSNGKVDPAVLTEVSGGDDADLDEVSVKLVAAIIKWDVTSAITLIRKANNARAIISKSRWLIDYLIGYKTKTAKFTPYSGRLYHTLEKKENLKTPLLLLVMIQKLLVDVELNLNSASFDETLVLYSTIGNFIAEHRP